MNNYFVYPMIFSMPLTSFGWVGMCVHLMCAVFAILMLILPERIFPTKTGHIGSSLALFGVGQILYSLAAVSSPLQAEQLRMCAAILHFSALMCWAYGVFKPIFQHWRAERKVRHGLGKRTDFFK